MLHILLLVLSIIGWILLTIIAILLLILCIVLFVPIRYTMIASCNETVKNLTSQAKITWLLHLIALNLEYKEETFHWRLRILHKMLGSDIVPKEKTIKQKDKKSNKDKKNINDKKKIRDKTSTTNLNVNVDKITSMDNKIIEDIKRSEDKNRSKEYNHHESKHHESKHSHTDSYIEETHHTKHRNSKLEQENKTSYYKESKAKKEDHTSKSKTDTQEEKDSIFERIAYTYEKVCDKIQSFIDKLSTLMRKKDKIISFLTHPTHEITWKKLLKAGIRILKPLRPKKIKGRLLFGFENPATTGYILAGTSILQPSLGKFAIFEADFDQQILDGELQIKSRIHLISLVIPVIGLLLSKAVRTTIRDARKFQL